jgi:glycosyltransferase involved in cell wall biosynthesis
VRTRILYVSDSLMAGGIESQLVELVTRLDRQRFDPRVLCLYGERTRGLHFAPQLREFGIPLRVLDIGWGARDKLRALAQIVATVHELRPAIVQAEGYHANLLTRLAHPLLPRGTTLIGTVRGVETSKQLLYERLSWRLCRRLVASGPHLAHALARRAGVPEARVAVIPNAIDVARFFMNGSAEGDAAAIAVARASAEHLRAELAPHGERIFISVGRISAQKRMHLIPEALGMLKREGRLPPALRVCIVGQVEDREMQARLEAAVRRDALEGVVMQHPATAQPERYYWAADASILFSTLEGISIAMLESLAAGRPVILSEEANAAGVIADGVTGWVARTDDTAHLAELLAGVAALPPAELVSMREACVCRAAEFSVVRLVERYAELYDNLLAGTARSGGESHRWRARTSEATPASGSNGKTR